MKPSNLPFRGWIATLSNGETIHETPPVPGEKTAWQKLIDRLTPDVKMTSIRVVRNGITINALPHKVCDGYYQAYEGRKSLYSGAESFRQGCGSVIGDEIFIIWIDSSNNIFSEIQSLSEGKLHTTLRDNAP